MQLRSGILGLALTSALALTASAADMYRGEPMMAGGYKDGPYLAGPSWTGFYVGVNGGGAWAANSNLSNPDLRSGIEPSGGFGGGQIGYNWQGGLGYSPLVLGVEADIQGADISDSATSSIGRKFNYDLNWFGTVRGRLGYAIDRTLVYGTGGFAYGHIDSHSNGPAGPYKFDDTVTGYVVGGGVEYKINPAWSLKAEYQYLNFGKNEPVNAGGASFASFPAKIDDDAFHTVRLGLNYKVGGAFYEPLK